MNKSGGATTSSLRSTDPIRSRLSEGAAQIKTLDAIKAGNDTNKTTNKSADSTDRNVVAGAVTQKQVNQSRGATASNLRTNAPTLTRGNVVAVQNELSTLESENVNSPQFSRNDPFFSLGTGTKLELTKSKSQFGAKVLNKALVKYFGED